MKLFFKILMLFLIDVPLLSQISVDKTSIDSGGAITINAGLETVYTIGEVFNQEISLDNWKISEGFISSEIWNRLGYEDYENLAGVNFYPNPTVDKINISLPYISNCELAIYNLNGKMIQFQSFHTNFISYNLSMLSSGTYFLVIKDIGQRKLTSFKVVKI